MRSHLRAAVIACVALCSPMLVLDSATAKPRHAATAPKAPKVSKAELKAMEAQLQSKDVAEIRAGLAALKQAGKLAAPNAQFAEKLLRNGLPPDLAIEAMDALGACGQDSSSKPVSMWLYHRDAKLRRAAARALTRTGGPDAVQALRRALPDADAGVRGNAANGIGALGARDAIADLFVALDHKIPEAAAAIGQLCTPEQCDKLAGKTGQIGFDVMTTGFDQILFRKPAEMPDDAKIRIVGTIRELGTGDGHRFLQDVQGRWPAGWSKKVKQAIDQAVLATEGSAGVKKEGAE